MTNAKEILSLLIGKEERDPAQGRGKLLRLKGKELYHTSTEKEALLEQLRLYESKGYLSIKWLEKDILSTVTLTTDEGLLRKACDEELERPFCRDTARIVLGVLEKGISSIPDGIEKNGLISLAKELERKGHVPSSLFPNPADDERMLKAIAFLVKNDTPTVERMMSVSLYRDSKMWERAIAKKTLSFLRRVNQDDKGESFRDHEVLSLYNVGKYPEIFLFSGPLSWTDDQHHLHPDLSFPGALTSCCLDHVEKVDTSARKIITVENMACYDVLSFRREKDTLVLYHAGFLSSRRRKWLDMVLNANETIPVYHWGDIDYGGFRMYMDLKRICPRIQPMMMDNDTLSSHMGLTMRTTAEYEKKLAILRAREEAGIFHPVITTMLEKHVRLEQEALMESDEIF